MVVSLEIEDQSLVSLGALQSLGHMMFGGGADTAFLRLPAKLHSTQ